MRTERIWRGVLVGALVFAGAGLWHSNGSTADARNMFLAPGSVATIDINMVLENLDERAIREDELKRFFADLEAGVNALKAELDQATKDLEPLAPGSQQFKEKRNQIVRLNLKVEGEAQLARALADERRKIMHKDLFDKIVAAVKQYADREGICMVFNDDSKVDIPINGVNGNQMQAAIVGRRILYSCDDSDISLFVAEMMNNQFRAGQ
ncbi:MAG: OmpH family outer membrane protein [Phycisphaerales bacterium]|nr:OmpH family outer membrane protein [Phycisphaerales bacterium]